MIDNFVNLSEGRGEQLFIVEGKTQFHALRTCPVTAANAKGDLLLKMTFWIL